MLKTTCNYKDRIIISVQKKTYPLFIPKKLAGALIQDLRITTALPPFGTINAGFSYARMPPGALTKHGNG